jgi:scyllo-inositol 2-dehydrogenase (NADP+)
MGKTGVGIASYGMSGEIFHAPLVHIHPGFEIISILERTKERSRERYTDAKIVRTYREMLEDSRIELVIVNTPDFLHYEMARDALLAGKHVVVEKPFVQDSRKGKELIDLAKSRNLLLSVFQNRRWDGDFLTVRKIMEEGLLGRLVEYEAHFDRYRTFIQQDTWKEDPASGTGTLFNLGSHLIDQAIVLFGKPTDVYADIRVHRSGGKIDDAFTLLLGYPEPRVTLKASYLVREAGPRYQLHGIGGSFLKYGTDPQEEALKNGALPGGPGWGREPETDWGLLHTEAGVRSLQGRSIRGKSFRGKYETLPGRYNEFYEDIHRALKEHREPCVTAEQANLVIRIIEAARESSGKGRKILL